MRYFGPIWFAPFKHFPLMNPSNATVALGLNRLTVDEKSTQFELIKAGMTGNAAFPAPTPKLADLGALCDKMVQAQTTQALALQAYKESTTKLRTAERAYDTGATQLGAYVETQAAGKGDVIQSAGMPVKSPNAAKQPMLAIEEVSVTVGDEPGQLDVQFHPVKNAKAYLVRYGQNGPDALTEKEVFVRSKGELHGLVSGKEAWLQVSAKGADGQGPWSQPVRCMVP